MAHSDSTLRLNNKNQGSFKPNLQVDKKIGDIKWNQHVASWKQTKGDASSRKAEWMPQKREKFMEVENHYYKFT